MTPRERAVIVVDRLEVGMTKDERLAVIQGLSDELARAWTQGWEIARLQMVVAGTSYAEVISEQSFLALTGPKTAVQGVKSFVDGIKAAQRPGVEL